MCFSNLDFGRNPCAILPKTMVFFFFPSVCYCCEKMRLVLGRKNVRRETGYVADSGKGVLKSGAERRICKRGKHTVLKKSGWGQLQGPIWAALFVFKTESSEKNF